VWAGGCRFGDVPRISPTDQFDGPYKPRGADPTAAITLPGLETPSEGLSARDRLLVALRDQGMTYRQMAQALSLASPGGLRVDVARARKKLQAFGNLFQIACDRMDQELVPLAVERMYGMVNAGVPEAVFRTLAGRGVLKDHRTDDRQGAPPGTLPALNVIFTQVVQTPTVAVGAILGTPRLPIGVSSAPPIDVTPAAPPATATLSARVFGSAVGGA
jgi:hypothetical protein